MTYPVSIKRIVARREDVATAPAIDDLQMIGPQELARRMDVSRRQVSRWLADGTLPPYDFAKGQTRRWREVTIRRWMDQNSLRRAS